LQTYVKNVNMFLICYNFGHQPLAQNAHHSIERKGFENDHKTKKDKL